jgi:hypothetical protein
VVVIDPEAEALVTAALDPGAVLDPPPHARVMQYKAAHGTQAIYHYAMSKLFPGRYESELDAAGAHVGPGAYNIHLGGQFISAALDQLPEPGRMMVGASRACQETILRRLVAEDKRIEFVTGTVVAFTADPTGPRKLTGVSYRPASDSTSSVEMKGDLIIGTLRSSILTAGSLTSKKIARASPIVGWHCCNGYPASFSPRRSWTRTIPMSVTRSASSNTRPRHSPHTFSSRTPVRRARRG